MLQAALFSDILHRLASYHGVGEPVHLDFVYDQIKEARKEDDSRLSQGVWKLKHKIANWDLVLQLCHDVLSYRSKDLQILGWFIEALTAKDLLKGSIRGFQLLQVFCKSFWSILYPNTLTLHLDDGLIEYTLLKQKDFTCDALLPVINTDDDAQQVAERRQNILDWIDKSIAHRLLKVQLSPLLDEMSAPQILLSDWIDATENEKKQKRDSQFNSVEANSTLTTYKNILANTPIEHLITTKRDALGVQESLDELRFELHNFDLPNTIQFADTYGRSNEIVTILDFVLSTRNDACSASQEHFIPLSSRVQEEEVRVSTVNPVAVAINKRHDAYRALEQIAGFLHDIDPHSPAPQLLDLILSWEHKSLLQILSDISNGMTDAHALIRKIGLYTQS